MSETNQVVNSFELVPNRKEFCKETKIEAKCEKTINDIQGSYKQDQESIHKSWDLDKEQLCVIMRDSNPIFYINNIEDARCKMKEFAERILNEYIDYHAFVQVKSADELSIIGYYKNYLISHPCTLDRLSIHNVPTFENLYENS